MPPGRGRAPRGRCRTSPTRRAPSHLARAARPPRPGGWRGGRRRSSRGRGTRWSRGRVVGEREQRELAALGEQHAVARPHLAVLLEEAVGRRRGAEDREDRLAGRQRGGRARGAGGGGGGPRRGRGAVPP